MVDLFLIIRIITIMIPITITRLSGKFWPILMSNSRLIMRNELFGQPKYNYKDYCLLPFVVSVYLIFFQIHSFCGPFRCKLYSLMMMMNRIKYANQTTTANNQKK